MRTKIALLVSLLSASIMACGKSDEEKAWDRYEAARSAEILESLENDQSGFDSPMLPPTNEGEAFEVASDTKARYRLLTWSRLRSGHREALTRRDGPSGTSFTRTEIDCENRLYKVRGEGDSRADALKDLSYEGQWTELVPGSIKDVTVTLVCAKAGS